MFIYKKSIDILIINNNLRPSRSNSYLHEHKQSFETTEVDDSVHRRIFYCKKNNLAILSVYFLER